MSKVYDHLLARFMLWWEANFLRHAWLVLLLFVLACAGTLRYVMDNLKVNTNTADMIATSVPFQKNRLELEAAFPQDVSTITLLVEGPTPELTADAVRRLGAAVRADQANFKAVYIPDDGEFFAKNGLLYLNMDDLDDLSRQLANAQPFIGRIAADNSLRGFFGVVGDALNRSGDQDSLKLDLNPLLEKIADAVEAQTAGRSYQVSWRQLMMPGAEGLGVTKRFIIVKPEFRFEELMPAEQSIKAIDAIIGREIQGDLAGVRVRKTGEPVLENEEMETISTGVSIASIASLILVCLTLWVAYRSFRLMFATFLSLTMGLIFSLGFATFAIGQLNLISIGFAVLFIGMGDAYSSHFCLRYRELLVQGFAESRALRETLISTAPSLVLSAITAAIGLFSYIPTSYSGVAELGIIAGTSMFIALVTTFTVLPALMKIMPIHPAKVVAPVQDRASSRSDWPLRFARPIQLITVLLAAISAGMLLDIQLDFNPINLRDPDTESVKTFKYLLESQDTSPMTLASLAGSGAEAKARAHDFKALSTVDKVVSIYDFIPDNQDEKLGFIEDLAVILGPRFGRMPVPVGDGASMEVVDKLKLTVAGLLARNGENKVLFRLDNALSAFVKKLQVMDGANQYQSLQSLEASLLGSLSQTLGDLATSFEAEPVTMDNLPVEIKDRWISASGFYRLQIFPKKNMDDLDNLREFILDAQRVDPNVTDLPVTYLESMNEVITAFKQAFAIAFIATTLILLLVLRSIRDTVLVLLPLLLASLFTAAATVILKIPFNFANIIALPLLFGLGVDSGIHMAHRLHYIRENGGNLLGTSESKGVFYGALTTIFSFSSLALTSHKGTASMGLLLAVGLLLTLICALVVLPAFGYNGRRR